MSTNQNLLFKNQRGQGLIEYLILVAIMAIASVGVLRVMSQTLSSRFATVTHTLQGRKKSVPMSELKETHYKKKDLNDFFHGTANEN